MRIENMNKNRKEQIIKEIKTYGGDVLKSEEMRQAFSQTHHLWSTVGEHSIRVAIASVMICHALEKLHVKVDLPKVVVGSLAHDLGILRRKEKFDSAMQMSREHPKESVAVAREILDDLPKETEDIIERHMWPLGKSRMPNSIEGMIVSAADKYSSVADLVKGSQVKHTGVKNVARGVKNTAHNQKDKVRKVMKGHR